jgi:hypothetical protein
MLFVGMFISPPSVIWCLYALDGLENAAIALW